MHNLAFLLYDKGEHIEAESLLREALNINIKAYADSHPYTASFLANLVMVLVARGSLEEAEKFFQKADEIDPEVLSFEVGGPWSNERKSSYGELLTNFGRYKEAERYLLIALDELKNRFGENDKRIWRPLDRLIKLYDAWENPTKPKSTEAY